MHVLKFFTSLTFKLHHGTIKETTITCKKIPVILNISEFSHVKEIV